MCRSCEAFMGNVGGVIWSTGWYDRDLRRPQGSKGGHHLGKHRRSGLEPAEIRNVIALIPAHNEAGAIADSIQGLYRQVVPPQRVIVVADNCTDTTVAI